MDLEANGDGPAPEPTTAEEVEPAPGASADGQPQRKRSRRGSRGGKKRRKPAANGEPEAASADPAAGDGDQPEEYVPMSEWIEDFDSRSRSRSA